MGGEILIYVMTDSGRARSCVMYGCGWTQKASDWKIIEQYRRSKTLSRAATSALV